MSRAFVKLQRHFFLQFFQVDAGGEGGLNPTAVLALLASPGAIMSFLLFFKYSPLVQFVQGNLNFNMDIASLADKYTFLALSMTVTGLVVVLRWESMFPDRRDYANLAALPVSDTTVLMARSTALAQFAVVFLVTVNFCSTLLFPCVALQSDGTFAGVLRFIGSHAVAVIAAGVWAFATFLALTGLMMALLPYSVFRRVRRYVQFGCIVGLITLFLSASAMVQLIDPIRNGIPVWAEWLPTMWFLGLYEVLQGKATGSMGMLAGRAVMALGISGAMAAVAYALSYRWFYLRTAETAEGSDAAFPIPQLLLRAGELLLPSRGFYRASLRFALRTLARSDRHTAAFAGVVGLGMALAVQSVNTPGAATPLPLGAIVAAMILVYALITGLRLCFGIASELRANWIFRIAADDDSAEPQYVVRAVMYLFLLPLVATVTMLFGFAWGWAPALRNAVFVMLCSALLIDIMTSGFRVIPFTCSWMPGRDNMPFALCLWAVGLAVFGHGFGGFGLFAIRDPIRLFVFAVVTFAILAGLHHTREDREPMIWADTRGELDLLRIGE
ncbi:MAG: hypothetical protein SGI92_04220 [Bryobacteraceae bacterium]|nr:hypothetical protein [Bryobacteraceae bacterium]